MSLHILMAAMMAEADARGQTTARVLRGGLALEARSTPLDDHPRPARRRQYMLARRDVPPSATEIAVVRRAGAIPPEASEAWTVRDGWHVVTITWHSGG